MNRTLFLLVNLLPLCQVAGALEPLPDKLVVLTFDDASKSHFTIARSVLLKYKFGATFFVTEGFDGVPLGFSDGFELCFAGEKRGAGPVVFEGKLAERGVLGP